jgi:hypothetical protein
MANVAAQTSQQTDNVNVRKQDTSREKKRERRSPLPQQATVPKLRK